MEILIALPIIKKMIAEVKPDAVVVAVPTKFHYTVIKDLLENGIHVFAEKPFCLTVPEGKELVELAAKKKSRHTGWLSQ